MNIPDRVIVRKIKEYDPHLYVKWNSTSQFFELWRRQEVGSKLITPITKSIYEKNETRTYAPLDERILWWIYEADSWRYKSSRDYAFQSDSRWREFAMNQDKLRGRHYRDVAKDMYRDYKNFYSTRHQKANPKHPYASADTRLKPKNKWIKPDTSVRTSSRIFRRSSNNALAYGFKK